MKDSNCTKLYFPKDAYYNGELKYETQKTYKVPNQGGEAERWIKRGAVPVTQIEKAPEVKLETTLETPTEAPVESDIADIPVQNEIDEEPSKGKKSKGKK